LGKVDSQGRRARQKMTPQAAKSVQTPHRQDFFNDDVEKRMRMFQEDP
jgi:hypothetical protein